MLVIRTGKPGHGKTLNSIKEIDERALKQSRVVYFHNINGLKHDKLKASWFEFEDPTKWHELPHNSIIVIDEAQTWFGTRDPRARPDMHITAFETMRHSGFEVHLITQDPRYIDVHARRLANEHIHYWRVMKSQSLIRFQSDTVIDRVEVMSSFKDADKTRIRLDKKYFDLYTSSNADHHFRFQPSKKLIMSLIVIIVALFLVFRVISRVNSEGETQAPSAATKVGSILDGSLPSILGSSKTEADGKTHVTTDEYIALRTPRIKNVPWSAPIYDGLTEPVTYPKLNCMSSDSKAIVERKPPENVKDGVFCECYTQQATPFDVDHDFCISVVKRGVFDPARPESGAEQYGRARDNDTSQGRLDDPALPASRFVTERDKAAYGGYSLRGAK